MVKLNSYLFIQKCIISEYITQNMYPLRYEIVTELSQRSCCFCYIASDNSRVESAKLFRCQHIGEHCPFKLHTPHNCSVRNGVFVLDDTVLRLRHEQDAFWTNQEKTHLFFCTACWWREQVSCDSMTLQ